MLFSPSLYARSRFLLVIATCALAVQFVNRGEASSTGVIVQVEEDWELVVITPDNASNSPQITCVMSPVASDESDYVSLELNYQSQPEYATGGLHLHAWDGAYVRGSAHTQPGVSLRRSNETIRWTQSMAVNDGELIYEVKNGESQTWGSFGQGELKLRVATDLTNLNAHRVEHSIAGSGVGYGANRVKSLVLKRVRIVLSNSQVYEFQLNYDVLSPGSDA